MTLLARPEVWTENNDQYPFDARLHQEYWDLFQMAIIGRDRQGYPGRRAFDAVVELGANQMHWMREQQPFILHTWQGELTGSLQPISDRTIFTPNQFMNEYQTAVNQTQGLDTLFLRSQLVAALIEQEKIVGHDDLFMGLKKLDDSLYERDWR